MKAIYMQYIGKSCLTIKNGDICELTAIKRVPLNCTNTNILKYFPSRIRLAFKTKSGGWLGWCDKNQWIKYNK